MSRSSPQRIGLLGGSFNPAHAGHVHLSLEAYKRLQLDAVWWIVSPHNPLKDPTTYQPFEQRVAQAQAITAPHRFIHISCVEETHALHYTIDTLNYITTHYPEHEFVWIMGADNLVSFHRWKNWRAIVRLVPIAVFNRGTFAHHALRSRCAIFARSMGRPITFFFMRKHPASATEIRKNLENHTN